jgi:hypothetical protein
MLLDDRGSRPRWPGRAARGLAVVAAIGVAALVALFASRDGAARSGDASATDARRAMARRMTAALDDVPAPTTVPAPATCFAGLDRFDADVRLGSFRAWAAPLLATGDPLVTGYLAERLAELIGDDEASALAVLAWSADAAPGELDVLLAALKQTPAIRRPAVADELARLALADETDPERRAALLAALDGVPRLSPTTLSGVAALAAAEEPGEVGWIAARTIGQVMNTELAAGADAAPYLDQLLSIAASSPDAQVRAVALEMPMHSDAPIDGDGVRRLAVLVSNDPDPEVRKVAIHDLSMASDRAAALAIYEEAFRAEHDICVCWALFRFAARLAGPAALPTMKRMAASRPEFQGDYLVFERIYASGVVDFERVWSSLPDDDPHGCLHLEEEGEE